MNFKEFYTKTDQRLKDSILSLWATGDAEMQKYFSFLLEKEKIMAKPVFQNTFPWNPSDKKFGELTNIFDNNFISKLDSIQNDEYSFPKDRNPYKHQVSGWKELLEEKKSILVTTGTGSGKTECFMLPVLYDIYKNAPNSEGINAIFLYPLNALIGSQKKRIHEWSKALGNVKYAVYNGSTPDNENIANQSKALPQLVSRKQIRETPPQILFTNPTMLEYILVRNKDVDLLKNSEGKLRWILLDEAHTLTGSKAAEMALLIRRVIDAFKVDVKNVRFAITSATVGKGNDEKLIKFMSDLCGIEETSIKIIKGDRLLPAVDYKNTSLDINSSHQVDVLRNQIYDKGVLEIDEIGKLFNETKIDQQLNLVDKLSEIKENKQSIFPVRGHFFSRNINGVYCCTNSKCEIHGDNKPSKALGTMYTVANKNCECGHPLLELVACRSCGSYMLEGEKDRTNKYVRQNSESNSTIFEVDSNEDIVDESERISNKVYFVKNDGNSRYVNSDYLTPIEIAKDGQIVPKDGAFLEVNDRCPHCGENYNNPFHFRISTAFTNRILSDVILEQTQDAGTINERMLWKGKKYISFTDSRQGTAKIAALINIDNESYWIRSKVYHSLCEKRSDLLSSKVGNEHIDAVKAAILTLKEELENSKVPILIEQKRKQIKELEDSISTELPAVQNSRMTWSELYQKLEQTSDLKTLYKSLNKGGKFNNNAKDYLKALFFSEFSRRIPRERSLENLGMVNLSYPGIDNISSPNIANQLGITIEDWKDLIKISLDYILRFPFHFSVPNEVYEYSTIPIRSYKIYPSDTQIVKVKTWPKFERKNIKQNRLALLICAGLNLQTREDIDKEKEDEINELLDELWKVIRNNFLRLDGDGYLLNLEEKSEFELADKLWLCPVKKQVD